MKKLSVMLAGVLSLAAAGSAFAATKADACNNIGELDSSVKSLQSVGAQGTVGDIKKAEAQVKDSYDKISDSADQYAKAQASAFKRSLDNLDKSTSGLKDEQPISQAQSGVSANVDQVGAAFQKLDSTLGCGAAAAPAPGATPPAPMNGD